MSAAKSSILIGLLILADQIIKQWAQTVLKAVGSIPLIPGFLRLTYVENYGAAFGILQGQRWILVGFTALVLAAATFLLLTGMIRKTIDRFSISLILAGGLGNLIDRIRQGFVIDYLDINELFSYPMFNLADCCVVVGAVLMVFFSLKEDAEEKKSKRQQLSAENEAHESEHLGDGS
jgi:signal peptidase II